jgi:hypothetical protein
MTEVAVYTQGWSLDDVRWDAFDASRITPALRATIKAASLVEFNAPDYVVYLKRVFKDSDSRTLANIEAWGKEEEQHGRALGRWAEIADPGWSFDDAFARFRAGYRAEHFTSADETSVRGSRRGEMIARCVVESGTSSLYSAIKEATDEPLLKEIAGRIAADEFRHYKLFFETLHAQNEPELPFWKRLAVAVSRMKESSDDEIAYAYYCANVSRQDEATTPYDREKYTKAYHAILLTMYRRHHVRKVMQMVANAVGANPSGRVTQALGAVVWRILRVRTGLSQLTERAAA